MIQLIDQILGLSIFQQEFYIGLKTVLFGFIPENLLMEEWINGTMNILPNFNDVDFHKID